MDRDHIDAKMIDAKMAEARARAPEFLAACIRLYGSPENAYAWRGRQRRGESFPYTFGRDGWLAARDEYEPPAPRDTENEPT